MKLRYTLCLAAGWLMVSSVVGCAQVPRPKWFAKKTPADAEGPTVQTPSQQLAELRKTAQYAASYSDAERQEISAQLCQGLRSEQDVLMRCEVLKTLAALKTEQGDAMLRAGLQDPETDVRVVCCEAWGSRGGPEAVQLMSGLLSGDHDVDVRIAAARSLGQLGDRGAVAALGAALEDTNPALQHRAVASLREVTGEDLGNDVNAWIAYVKEGAPQRELSLAERLFRWF